MRQSVIAGLVLALGCGSATETDVRTRSGPTRFEGAHAVFWLLDVTVSGIGVDLADGGVTTTGPIPGSELILSVRDYPTGCDGPDAGAGQPTSRNLEFRVTRLRPNAITPGEYPLNPLSGGAPEERPSASYDEVRGACVAFLQVTDGRMMLSRLTEQEAQGTVSAVLDDGTQIDGEFIASRCTNVFGYSPENPPPAPTPVCGP